MLKHNLRLFLRVISRQRLHSLLTIGGLGLGLTAVLLAFVFIEDEQRFDQLHQKKDRLFRVNKWVQDPGGERFKVAETPGLMAAAMDQDFPEVEAAARIAPWFDEVLLSYEDQHHSIKNWVFADSNFFYLFDFQLVAGVDPQKVLSAPGQMVISESLAKRLFGDRDPLGKSIRGLNDQMFTVSGVIEDAPRESHLQYDALVSWASTQPASNVLNFSFMNNWLAQTVYTYVLLRNSDQQEAVNDKMAGFTAQYMSNRTDRYDFYLQPFSEIYLHSNDIRYLRLDKLGSAAFLKTFSWISLLILLIACFNYINMTTARSLQRAKEVGVKKVLGAKRKQLLAQFLAETMGMVSLATLLAAALSPVLLPRLNHWFNKEIPNEALLSPSTFGFLILVLAATSLTAGLFPGLLLSRFKPVGVFQGNSRLSPQGEWPRQILTTLQLTVSVGLIIGTLLLQQQFGFLMNRDLGFDKDEVMVMHTPPGIDSSATAFRNALTALTGVASVSICQASVKEGTFGTTVLPRKGSSEELPVQLFRVDSNYLETYGMEMSAGRFLGRASDFEPGAILVNEAFVQQMGWENPLEESVRFNAEEPGVPIVGVLKDFNFSSLHQTVDPLVMYLDDRKSNISIRFEPSQLATLLPQLKGLWEQFEARFPFEYYFMDEYFAREYAAEKQMLRIISLFSFVAILIACLGLYGLSAFGIARKRKEIGIRKVLGASILNIVGMLSGHFLKLVLIALLIATPLVWYLSQTWLQNFAYHIDLSWWMFVGAGTMMALIVLLTVGTQSWQAARTNPVQALRTE